MSIFTFFFLVIACILFSAILIQDVESIFDWQFWLVIALVAGIAIVGYWINLQPQ